ncbi:hypothetical protein CDAR_495901 [Caerostris darwini]|uniref:Uncharacterized protein n=1 Tax=Caerostris darwini TaxID=1538125 RepID=A0AAV4QXZ1_9ARAC|nr:hypothetical protein CDAR_495901 [Caerostris darwini]
MFLMIHCRPQKKRSESVYGWWADLHLQNHKGLRTTSGVVTTFDSDQEGPLCWWIINHDVVWKCSTHFDTALLSVNNRGECNLFKRPSEFKDKENCG